MKPNTPRNLGWELESPQQSPTPRLDHAGTQAQQIVLEGTVLDSVLPAANIESIGFVARIESQCQGVKSQTASLERPVTFINLPKPRFVH
ncbi:MAG: hypothetical protein ACKN9W_14480 [Methylococcus sp.]